MESRIIELYVSYVGVESNEVVRELVYTNAPDDVLSGICSDIKKDGILNRRNGIGGIIGVLTARGYECSRIDNIPSFGFSEK